MGCFNSKASQGECSEKAPLNPKNPSVISNTTSMGKITCNDKNSSLDGFNIVFTDHIGERKGKITDYYSLLNPPIGSGSFGEVRRAIHKKSNITRAIKIIKKSLTDFEEQLRLINEVNVLRNLDHPNIMKIYEFFQDEDYFYIVSEYYNGGELFDKINSTIEFTERFAATTMKQILSAISYCHYYKIVHRDLKPENILYDSNKPDALLKIIDFGTSRFYNPETSMHHRLGTPFYVAPEVLEGNYTEKCDEWSCGVIMYILLCGFPPFTGNNETTIFEKVSMCQYNFEFPEWECVSDQAKSLVKKLLEKDPVKRISAEKALKDPWFKLTLGETTLDRPLAVSALENLKHFRTERKLQHAIWIFLVSYFATEEEKTQLLKAFQTLDLDEDGQLSREELIRGYQTLMNSKNPEEEVDALMRVVDNNNSGTINFTEFVIATLNRNNMLKKNKLEEAFKLLDKDEDGYITASELEEIFNPGKHKEIDNNVWAALIKEFDQTNDGKLSWKEFTDMMTSLMTDSQTK